MFSADWAWVYAAFLLWTRLGTLLVLSPLRSGIGGPAVVWVLLALALGALLSASLGLRTPPPSGLLSLVIAVLTEAALGALLGLALHAAFGAWALAGRLLDLQMGFGIGAVFDPITRSNAPVVGAAMSALGLVVFFTADAHHALMRGIVYSATAVPPGRFWTLAEPALLLRPIAAMFSVGVVVVAPAVFMLMMMEVVLGGLSRALPQMNVFLVGAPVKILVGLGTLAIAAPMLGAVMRRSYQAVFDFWGRVLS